MKKSRMVFALAGLCAAMALYVPAAAAAGKSKEPSRLMSEPVRISNGLVSGTPGKLEGVVVFKGIPFAAPPVGDLRWKPPQPVVSGTVSVPAISSARSAFSRASRNVHQTIARWICPTRRR